MCAFRIDVHTLACDAGISDATAYRFLHERLDVSPPRRWTWTRSSSSSADPARSSCSMTPTSKLPPPPR
jgi:hypothetical protein